MPIRAENKHRYPPEWPLISLWVRVCAGWRCEWCDAVQGRPHPLTGSTEDLRAEARRLDGLYTGQCQPEEYEHLIAAGVLRKTWDHPGGFLGLSKLEAING